MKRQSKKYFNKQLLLYYQCILAILAIFAFFTELDIYTLSIGIGIPPKFWLALLIFLAIPLFFTLLSRLPYLSKPLLIWCGFYLGVSSIYILFSQPNDTAFQELETRLLSVIFLLTLHLIFSRYSLAIVSARWAVFAATLMNIVNNILEFFNPYLFGAVDSVGRSSGFYSDSNMSGCAIILGFVTTVGILPKNLRFPFLLAAWVGIIFTFSRGAIFCLLIISALLVVWGLIPRKQFLAWGGMLVISSIAFGSLILSFVNIQKLQSSGLLNENTAERASSILNPTEEAESLEEDSRSILAKAGWNAFTQRPFLGHGIAYTRYWKESHLSTHNMYLYYMADHGLVGIFIFPSAIYVVTKGAKGDNRVVGLGFAFFIAVWGLFSHTVLERRIILVVFSLMASISQNSQIHPDRLVLKDSVNEPSDRRNFPSLS